MLFLFPAIFLSTKLALSAPEFLEDQKPRPVQLTYFNIGNGICIGCAILYVFLRKL